MAESIDIDENLSNIIEELDMATSEAQNARDAKPIECTKVTNRLALNLITYLKN